MTTNQPPNGRDPQESARCAFVGCQACGVILPGAPRVIGGGRNRGTTWHPGCYDAARQLCGGEVDITVTNNRWFSPSPDELDMSLEVTAR